MVLWYKYLWFSENHIKGKRKKLVGLVLHCYAQQMFTKNCISQSLWREEMGNWRVLNRVQGNKRGKERQPLMEHRGSDVTQEKACQPLRPLVENEANWSQPSQEEPGDSVLGLSPPCTLCSAALPHSDWCKSKRVRKLGCYSLYQSASMGAERRRRAEN